MICSPSFSGNPSRGVEVVGVERVFEISPPLPSPRACLIDLNLRSKSRYFTSFKKRKKKLVMKCHTVLILKSLTYGNTLG